MRAIVCSQWGPPEDLAVHDLPSPTPGPGQVRVKVQAAGVNFPDLLIVQKKYQLQPPLPFTPGAELAGVVDALGDGVTHLQVGQAVVGFSGLGAFAEEALVPANQLMPLPPGLDPALAASFTLAYGTSWHALRDRGALQPGETLLVLGAAGGVGLAAVEIAKAIGAKVIAAASSDDKLAVCTAHGADAVINTSTENLRERLKALTEGRGVDVIYDAVGGALAEPALRGMAWRGRYLVVGFASGEIPALPFNLLLLKGTSLVGVFWGEWLKREPQAWAAGLKELMGWLRGGQLRPLVSRRYALAETPQALRDLAERRVVGKVVIEPGR
jgi:NADPH2:quinone reductase